MKQEQLKKTLSILAIALFMLFASAPMQSAQASKIKAIVNGAVITDFDVAQRQRLVRLLSGGRRSIGTTAALNILIDDKLKLFEARRRNMTATDSEIDSAINNMALNSKMDKKRLFSIFKSAGVNSETLQEWLKVELSWRDLVRARSNATVRVDESEIYQLLNDKSKNKDEVEDAVEFDLTRVLFVTRKKASNAEKNQRMSEAKRFRSSFSSCTKDLEVARTLKDVAIEHIGRKSSVDLPKELQKRLRETAVNKLTPPVSLPEGFEMIAVCSKKDLGKQMTMRDEIQNKLRSEKSEMIERQYLSELRATAVIDKR